MADHIQDDSKILNILPVIQGTYLLPMHMHRHIYDIYIPRDIGLYSHMARARVAISKFEYKYSSFALL